MRNRLQHAAGCEMQSHCRPLQPTTPHTTAQSVSQLTPQRDGCAPQTHMCTHINIHTYLRTEPPPHTHIENQHTWNTCTHTHTNTGMCKKEEGVLTKRHDSEGTGVPGHHRYTWVVIVGLHSQAKLSNKTYASAKPLPFPMAHNLVIISMDCSQSCG